MPLRFRKLPRAQPLATLHDPGHRESRVVVQDRSQHAAEEVEGRDVAITERFRRLSRIRLDEAAIRMWQIHTEIMQPDLPARDVAVSFAKIRLRVTRTMAQRHEHLVRSRRCFRYILPHDRIAARKSPFIPETFENPLRRGALLLEDPAIRLEDRVDPRRLRAQLLRCRSFTPPVARRNRI